MSKTQHLNLNLTLATEKEKTFYDFRTELAGDGEDSNMVILDNEIYALQVRAEELDGKIDSEIEKVMAIMDYDADGNKVVDIAENSNKLGGELPAYYAKQADMETAQTDIEVLREDVKTQIEDAVAEFVAADSLAEELADQGYIMRKQPQVIFAENQPADENVQAVGDVWVKLSEGLTEVYELTAEGYIRRDNAESLTTSITELSGKITTLEGGVSQNTSDISQLKQSVEDILARLESLENV